MVQQKLNRRGYNIFTMLIYGTLQFFLYFNKTIKDNLPFTLRHMQSLISLIREKAVIFHFTSQRSTSQQIRMKSQYLTLRIQCLSVIINSRHLTRSHKYQCTFLIIVRTTSIRQFSTLELFQKNTVETKILTSML